MRRHAFVTIAAWSLVVLTPVHNPAMRDSVTLAFETGLGAEQSGYRWQRMSVGSDCKAQDEEYRNARRDAQRGPAPTATCDDRRIGQWAYCWPGTRHGAFKEGKSTIEPNTEMAQGVRGATTTDANEDWCAYKNLESDCVAGDHPAILYQCVSNRQ
jgi:hypothetical protein